MVGTLRSSPYLRQISVAPAALALLVLIWAVPPQRLIAGALLLVAALAVLRYPAAGFVLFAFSIPWSAALPLPLPSAVTSTDLLAAGIAGVWLARAAYERRGPIPATLWTPYLLLFLASVILSVSQATDLHASLNEILKWSEAAVVYFAAWQMLQTRRQVVTVAVAVVLAGVSQAALGYVQTATAAGPEAFLHGRLLLRAYGTFDQPNPFAGYLNMTLPFAVTLAARHPDRRVRRWFALAAVAVFGAILASESRGALLATVLSLSVIGAFLARRVRLLVWVAVLGGLIGAWGAMLGVIPLGPFARVLQAVGLGGVSFTTVTDANFSAVERAAHWLAGVRMFAAHPLLGVGIGNYAAAYPAYHPRGWYAPLAHAHNYYINIAAEAGIVGLATYLLLAGSALWYTYVSFCRLRQPVCGAIALGALGVLVATNFHNVFDVLYVHGMAAQMGLTVALAAVAARVAGDETPD